MPLSFEGDVHLLTLKAGKIDATDKALIWPIALPKRPVCVVFLSSVYPLVRNGVSLTGRDDMPPLKEAANVCWIANRAENVRFAPPATSATGLLKMRRASIRRV